MVLTVSCGSQHRTSPAGLPSIDGGVTRQTKTITATVGSTRFVTREHFIAAGEMQVSGEPFAEAMGRDLTNYSRDHLPPDLYFDTSPLANGPWIDLPGFSTAVESYEYSKQPMNNVALEAGLRDVPRVRPARRIPRVRRERRQRGCSRRSFSTSPPEATGSGASSSRRERFPPTIHARGTRTLSARASRRITRSGGLASGRRPTSSAASIRPSILRAQSIQGAQ